jgi:hypothetical protein
VHVALRPCDGVGARRSCVGGVEESGTRGFFFFFFLIGWVLCMWSSGAPVSHFELPQPVGDSVRPSSHTYRIVWMCVVCNLCGWF